MMYEVGMMYDGKLKFMNVEADNKKDAEEKAYASVDSAKECCVVMVRSI